MGQATVYCEVCGEMIPEHDFAKGKAIHFEGKNFCSKAECKATVPDLPGEAPGGSGSGVTKSSGSGVFKASTPIPAVRRVSGVFQPAAVGKSATSSTAKRSASGVRKAVSAQVLKPATPSEGQRTVSHAHGRGADTSRKRKGNGPNMAVIIGIIAGIVVLGVVGLLLIQSSNAKKAEREAQDRDRRAKAAVDEVRGLAQSSPNEFDRLLGEIAAAKDKVKGLSAHEGDLRRIEEDVKMRQEIARIQGERDAKVRKVAEEADRDRLNFMDYVKKLAGIYKEVPEPPKEFTEKVKEESRNIRQKGIQAHIEQALKLVYAPTPAYQKPIEDLTKLMDQCEDLADVLRNLQGEIDKIKKTRDEAAEVSYKKLNEEVDSLCDNDRFDEAVARCDEYPAEFQESKFYPMVLRLRANVGDRKRNKSSGGGGGSTSGGNGGNGGSSGGTSGAEVILFNGEDLRGWMTHKLENGSWKINPAEKSLAGENSQSPPHNPDKGTAAFAGSRDWTDIDVNFEAKVTKGTGFTLLSHIGSTGSNGIGFDTGGPTGWVAYTVRYRGKTATTLQEGKNERRINLVSDSTAGLVGFALESGQAAEFRNIVVTPVK